MKKLPIAIFAIVLGSGVFTGASAAGCKAPKAGPELSADEMTELHNCLHPLFIESFAKKGHEVGSVYGEWKPVSLRPAAPGVHSGQYLMTYVNDTGYEQYLKFATDGTQMPVGTIIAKENFTIKDSGKIKWGPLLVMTKVGAEVAEAADTGGWVYSGVKPKGKTLKVDGKGFCHACHQAYPGQDFLGYPTAETRMSAN